MNIFNIQENSMLLDGPEMTITKEALITRDIVIQLCNVSQAGISKFRRDYFFVND